MSTPEETSTSRKCTAHGAPTFLRCVQCDSPICPKCTVWTPVGQKCTTCAPHAGGTRGKYDRFIRPGVVVGILLLVLGIFQFVNSDSVQRSSRQFGTVAPTTTAAPLSIGEEGTNQGVGFRVSAFTCGAKTVGTAPLLRTAAGQFCSLTLKVRNPGPTPVGFNPASQFLRDSAGNSYATDARATIAAAPPSARDFGITQQLNPGISVDAVLIFDVPE
ncbi:MAG: DUF4352 domain-containing protein, partial [Acidimicrobiales bacterium]